MLDIVFCKSRIFFEKASAENDRKRGELNEILRGLVPETWETQRKSN